MRLGLLVFVLVVVLLGGAPARADDLTWGSPPGIAPSLEPYPPPPTIVREVSYARQTLISDGIAAAAVTTAFLQDNPYSAVMLLLGGTNVYAWGAPIVHFANRQYGNGLKSFGLRIALPWLGMLAGNLVGPKVAVQCKVGQDCPDPDESTVGLLIGAGLGAIAAVAIDARYLARKRVVDWAPPFTPSIGYTRTGFTLGVGGSF